MTALGLTLTILILLAVSVYLWSPVQAWRRYRGVRLVTCPETGRLEAVSINLGLAAFTALTDERPSVHLASCPPGGPNGVDATSRASLTWSPPASTVPWSRLSKVGYTRRHAVCGQHESSQHARRVIRQR